MSKNSVVYCVGLLGVLFSLLRLLGEDARALLRIRRDPGEKIHTLLEGSVAIVAIDNRLRIFGTPGLTLCGVHLPVAILLPLWGPLLVTLGLADVLVVSSEFLGRFLTVHIGDDEFDRVDTFATQFFCFKHDVCLFKRFVCMPVYPIAQDLWEDYSSSSLISTQSNIETISPSLYWWNPARLARSSAYR